MDYLTGQTIYEQILSVDTDNRPISAATFSVQVYNNGVVYTGVTVSISLSDPVNAVFSSSWSASTSGEYQIYYKNNITNVIFISDIIFIGIPDVLLNIYVGL